MRRTEFRETGGFAPLLVAAALLPGVATTPAPGATGVTRPNVVFILVDDLRYDALGCTGHPFMKTPNIDRIAREGVNFRNAFVTTPLCSPSRASLLTGRYAHAHGVTHNGDNAALSHRLVTFPRLMHDAGYRTAFVGKWHMGRDDSPRPGFDRWISFKEHGEYVDPVITEEGRTRAVRGYMTDVLTERAVAFIRAKRSKPFLLYLSHKAVHGPFIPAERHRLLYAGEHIPQVPSSDDDLAGKPVLSRDVKAPPRCKGGPRPKARERERPPMSGPVEDMVRNQLRVLQTVDDGVGAVFKALEETRQLDDTLIVFMSDNGFLWGDHGLIDKRAAYEESIRIPLLMRYPRFARPGTTVDQLVLNIDVAPTLCDLAGVAVPADAHGRSVLPLLRGTPTFWRQSFLAEYVFEPFYPKIPTWRAVRDARWKYIRYTELAGMDELYDLAADPYEMSNLIDAPSGRAELPRLKAEAERLLRETQGGPSR